MYNGSGPVISTHHHSLLYIDRTQHLRLFFAPFLELINPAVIRQTSAIGGRQDLGPARLDKYVNETPANLRLSCEFCVSVGALNSRAQFTLVLSRSIINCGLRFRKSPHAIQLKLTQVVRCEYETTAVRPIEVQRHGGVSLLLLLTLTRQVQTAAHWRPTVITSHNETQTST